MRLAFSFSLLSCSPACSSTFRRSSANSFSPFSAAAPAEEEEEVAATEAEVVVVVVVVVDDEEACGGLGDLSNFFLKNRKPFLPGVCGTGASTAGGVLGTSLLLLLVVVVAVGDVGDVVVVVVVVVVEEERMRRWDLGTRPRTPEVVSTSHSSLAVVSTTTTSPLVTAM